MQLSKDGVNSSFPALAGEGDDGARLWFMAQRNARWQVWYRTTSDLGATWGTREKISDATSGTVYKHPNGFDEVTATTARSRSPATATRRGLAREELLGPARVVTVLR